MANKLAAQDEPQPLLSLLGYITYHIPRNQALRGTASDTGNFVCPLAAKAGSASQDVDLNSPAHRAQDRMVIEIPLDNAIISRTRKYQVDTAPPGKRNGLAKRDDDFWMRAGLTDMAGTYSINSYKVLTKDKAPAAYLLLMSGSNHKTMLQTIFRMLATQPDQRCDTLFDPKIFHMPETRTVREAIDDQSSELSGLICSAARVLDAEALQSLMRYAKKSGNEPLADRLEEAFINNKRAETSRTPSPSL